MESCADGRWDLVVGKNNSFAVKSQKLVHDPATGNSYLYAYVGGAWKKTQLT